MACWLCIPWGDIYRWNMGPDNTPDITSHHLHNLYHRFIRLSIFYKMPYNKDIGDKVQSKFGQELLKLNLYHCLWIAIIYTINFDTIDAINHRAAQLFMLRITLISLTRLRKAKRGREIFLKKFRHLWLWRFYDF